MQFVSQTPVYLSEWKIAVCWQLTYLSSRYFLSPNLSIARRLGIRASLTSGLGLNERILMNLDSWEHLSRMWHVQQLKIKVRGLLCNGGPALVLGTGLTKDKVPFLSGYLKN